MIQQKKEEAIMAVPTNGLKLLSLNFKMKNVSNKSDINVIIKNDL